MKNPSIYLINSDLSEVTAVRLNALGKDLDFYKVGKVVFLSAPGSTNSSLVVGSNNIGTLPSNYRPKSAAFGKAVDYGGSMYLTVNSNGTVILTSDGAGAHSCAISLSYITD
jgi:hypothetical protein